MLTGDADLGSLGTATWALALARGAISKPYLDAFCFNGADRDKLLERNGRKLFPRLVPRRRHLTHKRGTIS
jgi:hypothetical protein